MPPGSSLPVRGRGEIGSWLIPAETPDSHKMDSHLRGRSAEVTAEDIFAKSFIL